LRPAETALVEDINRRIAARTLMNLAGDRLERPLDGGLIREQGDRLYPIIDQIPVLLPDEAIDLTAL
jgi:uncharacterized protein YbaR (Trm112 family)